MEANSKEIIRVNAPCHIQVKIGDQVVNIDVTNPHGHVLRAEFTVGSEEACWKNVKVDHQSNRMTLQAIPTPKFPFLDLPRELRGYVYRLVLFTSETPVKLLLQGRYVVSPARLRTKFCGKQGIGVIGLDTQTRSEALAPLLSREDLSSADSQLP
ncbi:hypothetical protein LTS18_004477 [Coniosporium uncinatum]|uniref:Uncharacterized protein n=1 Tax=Coniosporium uncinatum TaxID=93489 RepID=A0ACC3DSQ3_9PEZI|nr:hypothetical protein LTS18_004477 [Coniosporium uncinatum]